MDSWSYGGSLRLVFDIITVFKEKKEYIFIPKII